MTDGIRDDFEEWEEEAEEDAEEVVAEILATEPELARRWHDHPTVVPFKAVAMFIRRNGRRIAVSIVGGVLVLMGLAGLALPILPGWLLIFAGFGVLSSEYVWAERMLKKAKKTAEAAKDKALNRKNGRARKRDES